MSKFYKLQRSVVIYLSGEVKIIMIFTYIIHLEICFKIWKPIRTGPRYDQKASIFFDALYKNGR